MWVKEVIIDGFKSYANRTVISGWDPKFNAITGLNGTGKSNILDSICFVLGISNLSQVRVHNLQELVYKKGQSRVTKASVTIVFDNRNTKSSPVGYEQYEEITVTRQIVIGGRNKYLINGHTAQLARVQNLFHSVQLNVNNPHFLIMQGRITKVVNMKPPEVLSMIEEAAGTRMYENKKKSAERTIAKKQIKVDEMNKILAEEVTPSLEKLRKERSHFIEWSANNTEIERLSRFSAAASFFEAEKVVAESQGEITEHEAQQRQLTDDADIHAEELAALEEKIAALNADKNQKMQASFKDLEKQVSEHSKQLVAATTAWQHQKDDIDAEQKQHEQLGKTVEELAGAIEKKDGEIEVKAEAVREQEEAHAQLEAHLASLQGQLLGIGMGDGKGGKGKDEQGSLVSQLMQAQQDATQQDGAAKLADNKAKHLAKEIKAKAKEVKAQEKQYAAQRKGYESKEKKLAQIDSQLSKTKYDPEAKAAVEAKIEQLEEQVQRSGEKAGKLRAQLSRVDFDFASPSKGFDRSKVKGLVARLIKIEDPAFATALEVTAGGKLYNVVVDTQQTGKQLLQKGKLRRRVTIIPLNKISAREIEAGVVKTAQDLVGKNNVRTAISLVGYDKEVDAAMRYVFGSTFVAKDAKTAEAVTFHKGIKRRSVTPQGDMFDPAGTLSGGSRPKGGSVLQRLQELNEADEKLAKAEAELASLQKQHAELVKAEEGCGELTTQKELLHHEMALLKTRLDQTEFAQLNGELEALQQQLTDAKEAVSAAKDAKTAAEARAKELEHSIKNFEKERKNMQKKMEKELASSKKTLAASTKKVKAAQAKVETLRLEREALVQEQEDAKQKQSKLARRVVDLEETLATLHSTMARKKDRYLSCNGKLDAEKEKLAVCDQEIAQLGKQKSKLAKAVSDNTIELKKLTHKLQRLVKEQDECQRRVQSMLKKYDWIKSESHLFGQAGTDYDFDKVKPKAVNARLGALQSKQEELGKKINKKVMGMFEKAEQEYNDLMRKRDIIEKDKSKIEEVIKELDRKKNEALETTWAKVTKDFGSIFSTLLPGATGKLEPPEGMTVLDGLEVKVAFGGVWKDSLSELSGGQRSLLALSLILALLLFKPAPMYILDEIDAALDLSHTQNIGTMLKTHFPQSQFIVVSLKEGMFNNANVIFRTKFVDGVSAVTRTANRSSATSSSKSASSSKSSSGKGKKAAEPKSKRQRKVLGSR